MPNTFIASTGCIYVGLKTSGRGNVKVTVTDKNDYVSVQTDSVHHAPTTREVSTTREYDIIHGEG